MPIPLPPLAAALYLLATASLYYLLRRPHQAGSITLALGACALTAHAVLLYANLWGQQVLNVRLADAGSMVSWVAALVVVANSVTRPMLSLGLIILPLAAITVFVSWVWPGRDYVVATSSNIQTAHSLIAILAFGCLGLAVAQALLLAFQERRLRRQPPVASTLLPSIETMERLLFQLVLLGFLLLTITLISGTVFSQEVWDKPFHLNHHTILSLGAWISFGLLLVGRRVFGWRGRNAVRWTLVSFGILFLGYFGTRFIIEVILNR